MVPCQSTTRGNVFFRPPPKMWFLGVYKKTNKQGVSFGAKGPRSSWRARPWRTASRSPPAGPSHRSPRWRPWGEPSSSCPWGPQTWSKHPDLACESGRNSNPSACGLWLVACESGLWHSLVLSRRFEKLGALLAHFGFSRAQKPCPHTSRTLTSLRTLISASWFPGSVHKDKIPLLQPYCQLH